MDDTEIDVLAYEPSPSGMICLRRRAVPNEPGVFATEITLDHQFLMSSANTQSERELAARALELHGGANLRVLVGGLGLGYTAAAALRCDSVGSVEVVELLAPVLDWLERGWFPLAGELRADARFAARQGDVYAELAAPPARLHDLILIDVDHSPAEHLGASSAGFYTAEGLAAAKRHLAPGGVLGVWSYAESTRFADALRAVFSDVRVASVRFENAVVAGSETNWLFFARA